MTFSSELRIPLRVCSSGVSALAVLVWGYIDMRQGRNAKAWPSVALMVEELGASRKRIMRAVAELEEAGLLTVSRKNGAGNQYAVVRDQSHERDRTGDKSDTGPASGTGPKADTPPVPPVGPDRSQNRHRTGPKTDTRNPHKNPHKNLPKNPHTPRVGEGEQRDPIPTGGDLLRWEAHTDADRTRCVRVLHRRVHEQAHTVPPKWQDPEHLANAGKLIAVRAAAEGRTFGSMAAEVFKHWAAMDWAREQGFPLAHLVKQFARIAAGEAGGPPPQRKRGGAPSRPASHAAHAADADRMAAEQGDPEPIDVAAIERAHPDFVSPC